MKKSKAINILLMSVGIIFGAYKFIWGFSWFKETSLAPVIMGGDSFYFIFVSILAGMCNGFGAKIAKAARCDETECKTLIKCGFWIVLVLSISAILMYNFFIYPFLSKAEVYGDINIYLHMYIKGLPFTVFFAYILVIIRALGNYKFPCLFIACAVLIEWGMIRILVHADFPGIRGFVLTYITNVRVLLNILLFLVAYVYFRIKYFKWCKVKISMKIFAKTLLLFFKAGCGIGLLGLPLSFMILMESKKYVESFIGAFFLNINQVIYFGNLLLLGAIILAPFMARVLVEKYAEE